MAKLNECLIIWETELGSNKWNAIAFDGVRVESHTGENIVTSYPVSKGFNVNEHTIRQNSKIQLDAIISNISLPVATTRQSFEAAFAALCSAAGGTASLDDATTFGRLKYNTTKSLFDEDNNILGSNSGKISAPVSMEKVNGAFNEIVKLTRTGSIVHLLTMRGLYLNCVVRNYAAANDVTNSYSLPIRLNLEQLVLVKDVRSGSILGATSDSDGSNVYDDVFTDESNSGNPI